MSSSTISTVPSHQRKQLVQLVRSGKLPLRVAGTQATGFTLVAQRGTALIGVFGQGHTFTKQGEAVDRGEQKFGQRATKLVASRKKSVAA